jgi:hypothetical protein
MAIKYLAGERLIGTAAERAALSGTNPAAIPQTSWKELDRYTVSGSAVATMDTGTFTAKDNIMILIHGIAGATYTIGKIQFNSDTGSNYAWRRQKNGTSDATSVSQSDIELIDAGGQETSFLTTITIKNIANREKFVTSDSMTNYVGSGTAPRRFEIQGKWANTANQITSVQVTSASSQTFGVGSEVVVLGCDDDEADSGTSFWQEIGSDTLTSQGDVLTTGTITAKKWLWIQTHHLGDITSGTSANSDYNMTFNDSTSGYATRQSQDGAGDGQATGTAFINGWIGYQDRFVSAFVANVASIDKIATGADCGGMTTYGSGAAPHRNEWVGKWSNTSDSITKVTVTNSSARSGAYGVGSSLKVWGSN